MNLEFYVYIGILGAVFYLASHSMRRMVRLRVLTLMSNVLLLTYAVFYAHFNMPKLFTQPELLPHLHHHKHRAGHTAFRNDVPAACIYYLASRNLKLHEISQTLQSTRLLGQIDFFSPAKTRA